MRDGLEPFVAAQDPIWDRVLHELSIGQKSSHWMWFVFPQLSDLGRSERAQFYGLVDASEARAYAAHPILGPRLATACEALLAWTDRSAEQILGPVDAMKLCSSATLFAEATGDETCAAVLDQFCEAPCAQTLERLRL